MLPSNLINPVVLLSKLVILLFAFPLHELAHAITADRLGDPTPRSQGRLTLNPLAHLDLLGSILLFVSFFGWAKPVYTNPRYFRNGPRAGMAIVALAGPMMNLLLAIIGSLLLRVLVMVEPSGVLSSNALQNLLQFANIFVQINLYLMLFNLLPIGMLDGLKVLRGIAPYAWDGLLDQLERWGMFILMLMIFLPSFTGINPLGILLGGPFNFLYSLLLWGIG